MQEAGSNRLSRGNLANALLVGATLTLALLVYGALRFPASVAGAGSGSALVTCAALLAYAAASRWGRRASSPAVRTALATGAGAGVLLGAAVAIYHFVEMFVPLRPPLPVILGAGTWGLMFLLFGAASAATYRRVGSMALGVLASVWGSLVSTVILVLFAVSLALLFLPHVQGVLAGEFAASGMTDPRAFVVRNLFEAASSHLLLVPIVALVSGVASGVAYWVLKHVSRVAAVSLAAMCLVLLVAGAAALGFASSLERSARPPFVRSGLSALFVALTSAYPILLAIRRVAPPPPAPPPKAGGGEIRL